MFVEAHAGSDELSRLREMVPGPQGKAFLHKPTCSLQRWSIHYTGRPAFVSEIGGGMERDMGAPSAGTLAVIAILFYLTHRRWRPLLWLIVLLILILAGASPSEVSSMAR